LKLRKYFNVLLIVLTIVVVSSVLTVAAEQTALERILSRGKIIVGTDASIKPLSFTSAETGEIEGFIADLVKLYAEKLGVEIELRDFSWSGLFPALSTGKIDLVAANITTTIPRTASLGFVEPWLYTGANALVRIDAPYKSLKDLNSEDITFGLTKGNIYLETIPDDFPKAKVLSFDSLSEWLQALLIGRIDVVMDDELVLKLSALQGNEDKLKVIPESYMPQTYRWAANLDDRDLRKSLDIFFQEIKATGEYAEIYKKWMNEDWNPQVIGF
jgi:polar amino acid transport system substrate-binding protein